MFKTFLALTLVLFGVTACNSGINKELALKYGIDPEKPIKAEGGGCIPELEGRSLPLADGGYGQFISGGEECYATKVIDSPNLKPNETAEKEFIFLHGDGHEFQGRAFLAKNIEKVARELLEDHHSFINGKFRIRIIGRLGHVVEDIGRTTIKYSLPKWGSHSYTTHAGYSFANLLISLHQKKSSNLIEIYTYSGGIQSPLLAAGKFYNIIPPISKITALAPICDIDEAKKNSDWKFPNADDPAQYLKNISHKTEIDFITSTGEMTVRKVSTESCVRKLLQFGHPNTELHMLGDISHLKMLNATSFILPKNSIYDSLPK